MGGPDPGAQGSRAGRTLSEDEYAYDTMLRTARGLLAQSATVYIIVQDTDGIRDVQFLPGDKDEKHLGNRPISLNQLSRLRDRVQIINSLYDKHRATAKTPADDRNPRRLTPSEKHADRRQLLFRIKKRISAGKRTAADIPK